MDTNETEQDIRAELERLESLPLTNPDELGYDDTDHQIAALETRLFSRVRQRMEQTS